MSNLNLTNYGSAGLAFPNINVNIKVRDVNTGEIVYETEKHNRVLKKPLYTLLRVINGEFSECDDQTVRSNKAFQLYNLIPRYIAFGSGTTEVDINDTKLEKELDVPRMEITRNNTIENRYESPYIKLIIKHFVPMSSYNKMEISEAGLFCEETGDNCFARITFDPFEKTDTMVIDITWSIKIIIIETETEPYKSIDKLELKEAIYDSIDYISKLHSDWSDVCEKLKTATNTFINKTASQTKIDESTIELVEELEKI